MKTLILLLLAFTAAADNNIELSGQLAIAGTGETAGTTIVYDQDGSAVQFCIALQLNLPPGAPIGIKAYGRDAGGFFSGSDFSGQTSFSSSFVNDDLSLVTEGGTAGRFGLNVFVPSLKKVVEPGKSYSLKFTRTQVSNNDTNNTDITGSITNLSRGLNFGFVVDKEHNEVNLLETNSSGYGLAFDGSNTFAAAKLTRLPANNDNAGIGYVNAPGETGTANESSYPTPLDLSTGDIELRLTPGIEFYTLSLYANNNLVLTMETEIENTITTLLPFFHLNNWKLDTYNSNELIESITVEVN